MRSRTTIPISPAGLLPAPGTWAAAVTAAVATGVAYYAASEVGLHWFLAGPAKIAEVWPASGVMLAALLLMRRRWWALASVAVFVANFGSEVYHRSSWPVGLGLAAANVSEGLVAAGLVVWLITLPQLFATTWGTMLFGAISCLGPVSSATIGSTTILLAFPSADFGSVWVHWWVADAIGLLVVTPFILCWARPGPIWPRSTFDGIKRLTYLLAVTALLVAVFVVHHSFAETVVGGYLLVPALLLAAFRYGPRAVSTVGAGVTSLVVWRSTHDTGFFHGAGISVSTGVLGIQLILGALLLSSLVVAGLVRQRELAEEKARAGDLERANLAAIVNASDDAIIGAGPTGIVYAWNPGAERLFGWSAEEMIGRPVMRLADPDNPDEMRPILDRVLAGEVMQLEGRRLHRDGSLIDVVMTLSPVRDASGTIVAAAAIVKDIGFRKRAEAKMLAAQKLESLGMLAGNVAHDFNNLLVGILGNASLALEMVEPDAPVGHALAQIQTASGRAGELTRQLLAYSGKGRFIAEPTDLSAIARETAGLLAGSTPRSATIELELADGLPAVEADATQLRQVVMNLILNAAEALDDQAGTITIRTDIVEATADDLTAFHLADGLQPGRYVQLEVSDTGRGMDEPTLARIFDPFFSTKGGGRGLGLAALLGIVRGHHGAIAIRSAPGAGTRFRLLFPASERAVAPPASREQVEDGWAGHGLVLVADDDPVVRTLAVRMFEHLGFETVEASDGSEAIDVFRARSAEIRLVLLDLMMPGMHGTDVFDAITLIRPGVPVLLSSGYNTQDLAVRLADRQIAGFVQKPYELGTLRSAVMDALREPDLSGSAA